MALIELATVPELDCGHLAVCLGRRMQASEHACLLRALRWVGLEPRTLGRWAGEMHVTSERWLLLGMEV